MFTHLHRKQTGGPGEYAKIEFDIRATSWEVELDFQNLVSGGAIPEPFAEAVRDGVLEAMRRGILGVGPLVGVRFGLVGGATHPNDSSEHAFRIAGRDGFREAASTLSIGVLEPIDEVDIEVSIVHLGGVLSEIAARGGVVTSFDGVVVHAEVAETRLAGFHEALLGLTGGEAEWRRRRTRYDLR